MRFCWFQNTFSYPCLSIQYLKFESRSVVLWKHCTFCLSIPISLAQNNYDYFATPFCDPSGAEMTHFTKNIISVSIPSGYRLWNWTTQQGCLSDRLLDPKLIEVMTLELFIYFQWIKLCKPTDLICVYWARSLRMLKYLVYRLVQLVQCKNIQIISGNWRNYSSIVLIVHRQEFSHFYYNS